MCERQVFFSPARKNAIDEFQPQHSGETAKGVFTARGFCVFGIYRHSLSDQDAIVIANNALGLWHDPEKEEGAA